MARCVDWEWCISEVEWLTSGEWGDILENDFADSLDEWYGDEVIVALKNGLDPGIKSMDDGVDSIRLRLSVRRWETADREVTLDVSEAWVLPSMELPETTDDGDVIPKKIHRELAKFVEKIEG